MQEQLKEYDLKVLYSDDEDHKPIDFTIADDEDNVAWVWGDSSEDVEVECTHPAQCVAFDDDEPTGYCELCGATCDARYEVDSGNVEDYYWSGRRLVPTEWKAPDSPGGVIGKYLKELRQNG